MLMKLSPICRIASLATACARRTCPCQFRCHSSAICVVKRDSTNSISGAMRNAPDDARADAALPESSTGNQHPWHEKYDITNDQPVYKRYLAVYDREVTFTPDSGEPHSLHYDVVGHPTASFCFAVAVPFHPATEQTAAEVTLIREYAQGPNTLMYCFPSGGFDKRKHINLRECAETEMAEEAMLVGGEVVPLMPEDHEGQSELKWSRNTFKPFLIVDPKPAPTGYAATRDLEEHTIEVLRVTIPELKRLIAGGEMMLPSVYAFFLAQDVLQERKLI